MKKIFWGFLFFFLPIFVSASTVDYDVEQILVDANILENGDMRVNELIVLDGTFHGYERDLIFKNSKLSSHAPIDYSQDAIYNASDISDVEVRAKKVNGEVSFDTMKEDFDLLSISSENYATNKNYVLKRITDGYRYRMYYKSDRETVAFYLSYTIKDVIVMHQDVAELYWTFIGEGFDDNIGNVRIRVTLPDEDDKMLYWAHGDLTGEIQKLDQKTLEATIIKLPLNSPLDIRLTFSKELLQSSLIMKQSFESALPSILEVEKQRAVEANEQREKARRIVLFCTIFSGIYLVLFILWWIYVYFKYDKEYKPEFDLEYNREFIDDYNVEVVEYLMKESIGENAFSASILNLVYKKNIELKEMKSENPKTKQYEFTLLNKDFLNETESILVDFLFERVGKNGKFTTLDLKKYASSTKTYSYFQSSYSKWLQSAREDARKEQFFEKKSVPLLSSFLFLLIGIFLISYSLSQGTHLILPWICSICSILFFFYCAFLRKRSKKGAEHYARWKAFKKFLEDFGTFDIKELPEIVLWERYLVYATVFGIADKVQKNMNVKIKEMNLDAALYTSYYPTWIDYSIASSINRSVQDSFRANRQTYSRQMAQSSSSSGSGHGGGFSSGGGFGGGGGGGRGF